jgi:hypothetical protein
MHRRIAAGIIAVLAIAVLVAHADDFWVKKPWKDWSKGDIEKLTHDSPWARKWKLELINTQSHLPSVSRDAGTDLIGGADNTITYYVQFRSSMPLREAVIREKQIQQKYDKMSDSDKKAFDNTMEQVMKGNDDVIQVHVAFETSNRNFSQMLTKYWSSLPAGEIPEGIYLVADSGNPVGPLTFAPPPPKGTTTEFDLTFPRMVDNKPVIGANAKSIMFEFPHPAVGSFYPAQTAKVEFTMANMMWDGKPSF